MGATPSLCDDRRLTSLLLRVISTHHLFRTAADGSMDKRSSPGTAGRPWPICYAPVVDGNPTSSCFVFHRTHRPQTRAAHKLAPSSAVLDRYCNICKQLDEISILHRRRRQISTGSSLKVNAGWTISEAWGAINVAFLENHTSLGLSNLAKWLTAHVT